MPQPRPGLPVTPAAAQPASARGRGSGPLVKVLAGIVLLAGVGWMGYGLFTRMFAGGGGAVVAAPGSQPAAGQLLWMTDTTRIMQMIDDWVDQSLHSIVVSYFAGAS